MKLSDIPKLNIPDIDAEHKDIVLFLAQLNSSKDKQKVAHMFVNYANKHFAHEEDYMAKQGYPIMEQTEHIIQHLRLKAEIRACLDMETFSFSDKSIEKFRISFLTHIAIYDKMWADWLDEKSPGYKNPHY